MNVFERYESQVRSYCRDFPTVFRTSRGAEIVDEKGRVYLDFFSGAGSLNYGHNNERLKRRLLHYVESDGLAHGLDMATVAKGEFLERFHGTILAPRGLDYRVQFPGPTGANAVEAALKLARKVTGRSSVVFFTNAYHGMSLGALAVTGNGGKRAGAGVPLSHATVMPYDGYLGPDVSTLAYLEKVLDDGSSGVDLPAAAIVETVQAEGGVNVAQQKWLQGLEKLLHARGVLLIVDDIQVGCGRTGSFFSFEEAGLHPDLICLSKSISGYGLPMSLVLIRPELDIWKPGEHNGTFRGNNLAFVTATEALSYWETDALEREVARKSVTIRERLHGAVRRLDGKADVRGRGLILGLGCHEKGLAKRACHAAFERGLIIETAGATDNVVKLLPPLTIEEGDLDRGLAILEASLEVASRSVGS